jgi:hypothetical protein
MPPPFSGDNTSNGLNAIKSEKIEIFLTAYARISDPEQSVS